MMLFFGISQEARQHMPAKRSRTRTAAVRADKKNLLGLG
jgi:hypothetical protein